jgi:hypothetical protein
MLLELLPWVSIGAGRLEASSVSMMSPPMTSCE